MSLLFVHNQHSKLNNSFYIALAENLFQREKITSDILFWNESDINKEYKFNKIKGSCFSFENFYKNKTLNKYSSIEAFVKKYHEINWSQIISSERAFSDYSMLLGSTGNRTEDLFYIQNLVINITKFLSYHFKGKSGIICQTSDTLFSHIAIKLAYYYNVKIFIVTPCLFYEGNEGGGFFAKDENLRSDLMIQNYQKLKDYKFTKKDLLRIKNFKNKVLNFKNKDIFIEKNKGSSPGKNSVTPNLKNFISYILKNNQQDKNVFYTKIDPIKKIKANLIRLYRKNLNQCLNLYESKSIRKLPKKNIFFAMHFQPEQSTLTQGNWYLNQIALIENISKSLPLNYTVIVKEHPWGRGTRPTWQYKYLLNFHNVIFCDAPSKEIIKQTDAVLTISGSIILEAMVIGKPTIMFGNNFFDYSPLVYKINNISDLPNLLFNVLIEKNILSKNLRDQELNKFIYSYINSLIRGFPIKQNVIPWADKIIENLNS